LKTNAAPKNPAMPPPWWQKTTSITSGGSKKKIKLWVNMIAAERLDLKWTALMGTYYLLTTSIL
jgi:hypothetical protein